MLPQNKPQNKARVYPGLPRKDALGSPYGTASSPPTSPHIAGPTPEAAWGYLGREGRKKNPLQRPAARSAPRHSSSRIQDTNNRGQSLGAISLQPLQPDPLAHTGQQQTRMFFFYLRLQILNLCSLRRLQAEHSSKKSRFSFFHWCKQNNPGALCT